MEVTDRIKEKLNQHLSPGHMELINESHMHAGPATESHFKLVLSAPVFAGLPAVRRHQMVYGILREELDGPVHALALHLYSPEEWEKAVDVPNSPACAGKNK